jgi:phospholipid N-methyltransferase
MPSLFLSFLRSPKRTGAIAASSRWLARRMVEEMGLAEARVVVELGPGTGAFTGAIAAAVGPSTRFIAVELNEALARDLPARFPGVDVVNDSAEHVPSILAKRGLAAADAILCGLPWAGFPDDLQQRLMKGIVEGLRPGGRFATFAYLHAAWFPAAKRFRRLLEERFSQVTTTRTVWRNLPPAFVYRCQR